MSATAITIPLNPATKAEKRVSIQGLLYLIALVAWVTTIVVMSILGLWKGETHWRIDSWFLLALCILSNSPGLFKKVVR